MTGREERRYEPARAVEPSRRCEWPGCDSDGAYRAPRSPTRLRDFRWFCLDHIRAYNGEWNYFAGMNEREIEQIRRRDTVWHRPSWPLGGGTGDHRIRDPYGELGTAGPGGAPTPRDDALAKLGLDRFADLADIKARYKILVKKHHPDTNGGSKSAEEKFKAIHEAYRVLLERRTS